jgi:hypothetical protein
VFAALALALLAQLPSVCGGEAVALAIAGGRARSLDLVGALAALEAPEASGCPDAEVAHTYLRGLLTARDAYGQGGSPESLAPVRQAIAALAARSGGEPRPAEIARLVLLAAAAAAQSERDEMGVFLAQAAEVESLQITAGQPGAPLVTALESAGDLWLQVHRYEDARLAYQRAAGLLGATPRITAGLARAAARVGDVEIACSQFRALLAWWGTRGGGAAEIAEAREYVRRPACGAR